MQTKTDSVITKTATRILHHLHIQLNVTYIRTVSFFIVSKYVYDREKNGIAIYTHCIILYSQ